MPRIPSVQAASERAVVEDTRARSVFGVSDSFQNFALRLGLGTENALSGSTYGFNPITRVRPLLEWIHRGSWLGGVAVDVVADDMTREGVDIVSTLKPDKIEKIEKAANILNIWGSLCDAVKWARLYGGSIAVLMIDGQKFDKPFRLETVGPGQFKGLWVLDRYQANPSLNDLVGDMGPDFGLPRYYDTATDSAGVPKAKIHYSRVIRLEGIRLPHYQRVIENLWGISVIERLYDRMIAFDSATQGAAQLVHKSYLRTFKVKNLREIVAAGGEAVSGLIKEIELMTRFQGIEGMTLMDLEDEFEAVQHSGFAGISEALIQFGQQLSGALQIPLVRLFGQSPAGLNSTGESDLRTYYDGIRQQQERTLRNGVETVYHCLAQSEGITVPKSFNIQFAPLWQMKEEDKVKAANDLTQAVLGAVDGGLVRVDTGLKELREGARMTGVWSNITDEEIAEAEDMPTPAEQAEQEQQMMEGGGLPGASLAAKPPKGLQAAGAAKSKGQPAKKPAKGGK